MLNRRLSEFSLASFVARSMRVGSSTRCSRRALRPSDHHPQLVHLAERTGGVPWLVSADESQMYYMGDGYESLTGLSRAVLFVKPNSWVDALHPFDRRCVLAWMNARGPGVHTDTREAVYRIVHPRASVREVRVCSWPVYDDQGQMVFRAGLAIGVTNGDRYGGKLRGIQVDVDIE